MGSYVGAEIVYGGFKYLYDMIQGPRGFQAFAEPIILLDAVLQVTRASPAVLSGYPLLLQG